MATITVYPPDSSYGNVSSGVFIRKKLIPFMLDYFQSKVISSVSFTPSGNSSIFSVVFVGDSNTYNFSANSTYADGTYYSSLSEFFNIFSGKTFKKGVLNLLFPLLSLFSTYFVTGVSNTYPVSNTNFLMGSDTTAKKNFNRYFVFNVSDLSMSFIDVMTYFDDTLGLYIETWLPANNVNGIVFQTSFLKGETGPQGPAGPQGPIGIGGVVNIDPLVTAITDVTGKLIDITTKLDDVSSNLNAVASAASLQTIDFNSQLIN